MLFALISQWSYGQRALIHCGKLIDGKTDQVKNEMTIVVEKDRITQVLNGYQSAKKEVTLSFFRYKNKEVRC